MLCLACVATLGYVCFWVSQGERWKYVDVHGERTAYSPLYRIGIVLVALSAGMLYVLPPPPKLFPVLIGMTGWCTLCSPSWRVAR